MVSAHHWHPPNLPMQHVHKNLLKSYWVWWSVVCRINHQAAWPIIIVKLDYWAKIINRLNLPINRLKSSTIPVCTEFRLQQCSTSEYQHPSRTFTEPRLIEWSFTARIEVSCHHQQLIHACTHNTSMLNSHTLESSNVKSTSWSNFNLLERYKHGRLWVSRGLMSHSTLYRSFRGRFLQARWPNRQRHSTEGSQLATEIGFSPARTTPLCYNMN